MTPNGKADYQFGQPPPPQSFAEPRSSKPTIAGILLILASILGLITSVGLIYLSTLDFDEIEDSLLATDIDSVEGTVEGTVTYALNGTAAAGVSVSLKDVELNSTTNNSGAYFLEDLDSGKHTLIVHKDGYDTIVHELYITGDDNELTIDFEMLEGTNRTLTKEDQASIALMNDFMLTCGVLILIFSILTFIGAYYSIKRTNYWLAKLGALFGILSIGIVLGIILSVIALLFLLFSKDSFN